MSFMKEQIDWEKPSELQLTFLKDFLKGETWGEILKREEKSKGNS